MAFVDSPSKEPLSSQHQPCRWNWLCRPGMPGCRERDLQDSSGLDVLGTHWESPTMQRVFLKPFPTEHAFQGALLEPTLLKSLSLRTNPALSLASLSAPALKSEHCPVPPPDTWEVSVYHRDPGVMAGFQGRREGRERPGWACARCCPTRAPSRKVRQGPHSKWSPNKAEMRHPWSQAEARDQRPHLITH